VIIVRSSEERADPVSALSKKQGGVEALRMSREFPEWQINYHFPAQDASPKLQLMAEGDFLRKWGSARPGKLMEFSA
jgi:hypothetical protein